MLLKKTLGDINFEPGNLWTFLPEKKPASYVELVIHPYHGM